jgi:hypothetical protein
MYWGLLCRIQQSYAYSKGSPTDARDRAGKLFEQLKAGDWGLSRGEKSISIMVKALAALLKVSEDEAQSRWLALSQENKRKVSHRADVLAEVARLKAASTEERQGALSAIL